MIFSKSFGYAVRGILYISYIQNEKRYVQIEEIAEIIGVPRHFMGKIMKRLAKEGLLISKKGPSGGFTINEESLSFPLIKLVNITDGLAAFKTCVLLLKECNSLNPCPMHDQMANVKLQLQNILNKTTIEDLLTNKHNLIKSISKRE